MKFEDAIKLKTGNTVFDCFGNKLLVCGIKFNVTFNEKKEESQKCMIDVITAKLNKVTYSYEDLFLDQEFLSDEEKILVQWISENKDFVNKNFDYIHIISHCFLQGFSKGYHYKKMHSIEELMQK